MTSLREQLFGSTPDLPGFRLLLPTGWERRALTERGIADLQQSVHEFFLRAGRPDLDGTFTPAMGRGLQRAMGAGARHILLPTAPPGGRPLPLSMIVSTIDGEGGGTLDSYVAGRLRAGASMLDDSGRMVTWRSERRGTGDDAGTRQVQQHYLEAVPETHRRKALLLTGSVLLEADGDDEPPMLAAAVSVFDAIASTLTWIAAADRPGDETAARAS